MVVKLAASHYDSSVAAGAAPQRPHCGACCMDAVISAPGKRARAWSETANRCLGSCWPRTTVMPPVQLRRRSIYCSTRWQGRRAAVTCAAGWGAQAISRPHTCRLTGHTCRSDLLSLLRPVISTAIRPRHLPVGVPRPVECSPSDRCDTVTGHMQLNVANDQGSITVLIDNCVFVKWRFRDHSCKECVFPEACLQAMQC